jgi:hypothetical protein
MNRFQRTNIAEKVYGYYTSSPRTPPTQAFTNAKSQVITVLEEQLRCAKALTEDEFNKELKNNFNTGDYE